MLSLNKLHTLQSYISDLLFDKVYYLIVGLLLNELYDNIYRIDRTIFAEHLKERYYEAK